MEPSQYQAVDVSQIIIDVEQAIKPKLQPGVILNYVLGAPDCWAHIDGEHVQEVLVNLLSNACKYTSRGAITYGYEIYDDELYFFVKDTGIGLTPEVKDAMFELFSISDGKSPLPGLGLNISKNILRALGGQIGVESRGIGKGSTFWFTVPYMPAESTKTVEVEPEAEAPTGFGTTILVAEDNESNFLLFKSILEGQYNVVRAHDGMEAVELFKRVNPDLILMDINMPNMDGYEAVREIRQLSSSVPVIAVTAYAFVTDRQRILENGFNSYVSKPINVNRFEKEIRACLGR